jgi:hypothetical protein
MNSTDWVTTRTTIAGDGVVSLINRAYETVVDPFRRPIVGSSPVTYLHH